MPPRIRSGAGHNKPTQYRIFILRQHAMYADIADTGSRYRYGKCVRPSVYRSNTDNVDIVSKRTDVSSHLFDDLVGASFPLLSPSADTKFQWKLAQRRR